MADERKRRSPHGDVRYEEYWREVWLNLGREAFGLYFGISVRKLIVVLSMNEEIGNRKA